MPTFRAIAMDHQVRPFLLLCMACWLQPSRRCRWSPGPETKLRCQMVTVAAPMLCRGLPAANQGGANTQTHAPADRRRPRYPLHTL